MSTITIDNTISLRDLARSVADVFRVAEHDAITVTRHNKPIARIVPYDEADSDNIALGKSKLTKYLTDAIKEQVVKKYKDKAIPSLEDQLSDL